MYFKVNKDSTSEQLQQGFLFWKFQVSKKLFSNPHPVHLKARESLNVF